MPLGERNLSELEFVRIRFLPLFEEIGNCQNWDLSESKFVRIRICQNWNLSELLNGPNKELSIFFSLKLLMILHI